MNIEYKYAIQHWLFDCIFQYVPISYWFTLNYKYVNKNSFAWLLTDLVNDNFDQGIRTKFEHSILKSDALSGIVEKIMTEYVKYKIWEGV